MGKKILLIAVIAVFLFSGCARIGDHIHTDGTTTTQQNQGSTDSTDMTQPTDTAPTDTPHITPPTTELGTIPTTEPSVPATEPSVPATEPSVPATEPTVPTTEPSVPVTEPSVPVTEPSVPTTEPTVPTTGPSAPTVDVPQPTEPAIPNQTVVPQQITVEASGVLVKENDYGEIDYSNASKGYVMVRYTQDTDKSLKAQVKGPSGTAYTYNLMPKQWAAFPFSDENGSYKITLYRSVSGSKFAAVLSLSLDVKMEDPFAPFLRSNQYVDFDAAPKTVAKAAQLTQGMTDPLKKVSAVYDYVIHNMTYDRDLASAVESGYLPALDTVLAKQKGICFDYAAMMTGMLRSQGVPTKLVVGYSGDVYHAWIHVWSENSGWIDSVIFFDGTTWTRMDPTFASGGDKGILDYIGDGKNYTAKYFY